MDKVQKKVLLDLFASPWSIIPIAGGLSAWMISWAVDGSTALNLGGLIGVLGGAGVMATRLIFGLEKITQDAFNYLTNQQHEDQENELDQLKWKLVGDDDPKTETYLTELRRLYGGFKQDVEEGKTKVGARPVLDQVHKLFHAAVKHLEHSYELWTRAKELSGDARESILAERRRVIDEVRDTIEHLGKNLEHFHTVRSRESESELSQLRKELDATMRVAQKAEQRVNALDQSSEFDAKEFEL